MSKEKQPAKVSYFFGPGWSDLSSFISKLWYKNKDASRNYYNNYSKRGLMSFVGVFWLMCSLSVVFYGTIFFALISIGVCVILSVFFVLVYLGFSLVWAFDRIYLMRKKIFTACDECKKKSLIPTYKCSNCGENHTNLIPGKYGILKRMCKCGAKIPTTFLNGRGELQAECHFCGTALFSGERVPICIPVVGGRSVGKTAFITAFSKTFIDRIAHEKGWTTEFYNAKKEKIYQEIESDYISGSTRMTDRAQDINKASSVSFSFFVRGKNFNPDRLVHIYDVAGEVFTDNSENEIQLQYEYCHGIVLMIDPFSISAVKNRYESELKPEDLAGIGRADIGGIVDSFLNKLREVTGLSPNKMLSTPIAIVISKIDIPGLKAEIGKEAVDKFMEQHEDIVQNRLDAEDYLCRKFLIDNGMASLVSSIDIKFKNNRYFKCSSIGHARGAGAYVPDGVVEPMEWIFRNADSVMRSQWNDQKFGKVPVNLE